MPREVLLRKLAYLRTLLRDLRAFEHATRISVPEP